MGWERFEAKSKRKAGVKLSINKSGYICIFAQAVDEFEVNKYKHIVLFANISEKKIGLKLTNNDQTEGAVEINFKGGRALVWAKSFILKYGFDALEKRQLKCIFDEKANMIVAQYE